MINKGLTAIVLLNYNSWEDTIECLESIYNLKDVKFEVFVVDNSLGEKNFNNIISWAKGDLLVKNTNFPELINSTLKKPIRFHVSKQEDSIPIRSKDLYLIKANSNKGFAAGNNIAIKHIKKNNEYDYIWLLNNDTVVREDTLKRLIETSRHKTFDIIGSLMIYYSNPNVLQGIGGTINKWFGTAKPIKNGLNIKEITGDEKIDYPIGASMMVTKNFLNCVGELSENYFLYYEEADWVLRGKKYGFKTGFSKHSIVYHKVGGSIGSGKALQRSEIADYYCLKNRIKFVRKFYPQFLLITYLGFMVVIFNRLRRKQFKYANNAIKVFFNIPVRKFEI